METNETTSGGTSRPAWPLAAAAGAVVGATVALLLAPQSGKETRKQIKTGAGKLKDGAGRAVEAIASSPVGGQFRKLKAGRSAGGTQT